MPSHHVPAAIPVVTIRPSPVLQVLIVGVLLTTCGISWAINGTGAGAIPLLVCTVGCAVAFFAQHANESCFILDAEKHTLQVRPRPRTLVSLSTAAIEHVVFAPDQCLITLTHGSLVISDHRISERDQQRIIDFLQAQDTARKRSQ